ncbi:MAG: class I SAM-dependent methyltransferase [Nitrospinae bacterium]|nr:class I SAM-dependent methyltransferase [Nitrospinota bacterium]
MTATEVKDNRGLRELYGRLHEKRDLRFPLADYPEFHRLLPVAKSARVLDVACGKGFFLSAGNGDWKGMGIDFSPEALAGAKRRGVHALVQGEAERLPFSSGAFDAVVNLGSLEHFLDKSTALAEMKRVVKPEGAVMIIVPNGYDLKTFWKVLRTGVGNDQDGQEETTFMAHRQWRALLEDNGLAVERTVKYNGFATIDWHYVRRNPKVITLTEKITRWFLAAFLRPLIPLNLSNYFIFICRPARRN